MKMDFNPSGSKHQVGIRASYKPARCSSGCLAHPGAWAVGAVRRVLLRAIHICGPVRLYLTKTFNPLWPPAAALPTVLPHAGTADRRIDRYITVQQEQAGYWMQVMATVVSLCC